MKKLTFLFLCLVIGIGLATAQTRQITGTVISAEDDQPVIGASVVVKGTTTGTVTDYDGKFSLTVPASATTLQISYIGMVAQDVAIAPNMRVVLKSDTKTIDEIVVTAMGIKRSEKAIGYAASSVTGEELTESRSSDVLSSLSGKIAGVQIANTSSDPGASNSIIIRGVSSLSGSNQPLFIVDGVPMNNSTVRTSDALNNGYDYGNAANMVNPDDVASMSILKGAAATALYGSRAANGVVLITTKGGGKSAQGIGVEFNTGVQIADILRLPEFQNEFGMGWDGTHTLIENGSWGPKYDGSMQLWGNVYNHSQKLKPFSPLENNLKDFFETGVRYSNSVSFTGGNDNTEYFASFSQLSDDGLIPSNVDTYDKYTFSVRGSHKVKALTVSTSINYADQTNNFAPTGQGLTVINSLYQVPRDISIVGMKDLKDPFNTLDYFFTPYGITNPYYLIDVLENKFNQSKTYGKVQADLDFLEYFKATYRLGLDDTSNDTKTGTPRITGTPGTPNAGQIDQEGEVMRMMSRRRELNHDFLVTFNKPFEGFDISAMVGTNVNERKYSYNQATVTGLDIPTYYNLSNSASSPVVKEYDSLRRLIGLFGEVQVGYRNFLYLTATARNDWSSTLPKGNNSFFYPGVTGSFVFSELLSDDLKRVVSLGKLRLAYGKTGNDADVYMIDPYYTKSSAYNEFGNIAFPLNGVNAFTLGNTLGNTNLSPEITTEYEIGGNVALFNGRISVDASFYNRKSDKQIFSLNMDPAAGYTAQNINLGEIQNKGVELLVGLVPVQTRDFTWSINWNFSKNNSEVLSLPEELGGEAILYGIGDISLAAVVGMPVGVFKSEVPERDPSGNIVVNASNGLPIAAEKFEYVGDINYDYEMGISNNFSYKGINLGFDIDIRQGGKMYSRTKDINYFVGNAIQTTYNDRNPFIVPNSVVKNSDGSYSPNSTAISVANMGEFWDNGGFDMGSGFLIDKSYVKLRSVTLGYDIPKSWLKNTFIQGLKVTAYGTNLLMWTPSGNTFIDPEVSTFGNDLIGKYGEFSANPTTRKFGFNVMVKF